MCSADQNGMCNYIKFKTHQGKKKHISIKFRRLQMCITFKNRTVLYGLNKIHVENAY